MSQPVLSIDVSKSHSHAAAYYSYNKPYHKPVKFNHTPQGIKPLINWLKILENETNTKPQVVMEATGNFPKPLKEFFIKNGYQVVELNPIMTQRQKRKTIRKVKTDPVDTQRIAKVYYFEDVKPLLADLSEVI